MLLKSKIIIILLIVSLTGCSGEAELVRDLAKLSSKLANMITGDEQEQESINLPTEADQAKGKQATGTQKRKNGPPPGRAPLVNFNTGKVKDIAKNLTRKLNPLQDRTNLALSDEKIEQQLLSPVKSGMKTPADTGAYSYKTAGRRDPFKSFLIKRTIPKAIKAVPLQPLQKFSIDNMNLIAIIWGNFGYKGMIKTPDGKSYILTKGSYLGNKNGIVTMITANEVTITTNQVNALGETITSVDILKLNETREKPE